MNNQSPCLLSNSLIPNAKDAVSYVYRKTCADCDNWVGRCLKGKINRIAADDKCELFTEKYSCKFELECIKEGKFNPKNYSCVHGGGVGCKVWRTRTNREISNKILPGDV